MRLDINKKYFIIQFIFIIFYKIYYTFLVYFLLLFLDSRSLSNDHNHTIFWNSSRKKEDFFPVLEYQTIKDKRCMLIALHVQLFSCEDNVWGLYQITILALFDIVNSAHEYISITFFCS